MVGMKPATVVKIRDAYQQLVAETGTTPNQITVARRAGASTATVSQLWATLIGIDRQETRGTTQRKCLGCQREFQSEGPHHRVCHACKGSNAWQAGIGDYSTISN
jgi:hypothetical protein